MFEKVTVFCERATSSIPLIFVLGFYVSLVLKRWWDMFGTLVWPDRLGLFVSVYIVGHDEKARVLRRTIMRYINLSFVLGLRAVSTAVKKRFPTIEHLVSAGFMTQDELRLYASLPAYYSTFWVPCQWAATLIYKARQEGKIETDAAMNNLLNEINQVRGSILLMECNDWLSIPLVYTQVVTIAVYSYFAVCLIGKQYLDPQKKIVGHEVDAYVPLISLLQFLFYMGWLKVAETLINPFGEDDDDLEVNFILERNLEVSYMFVDNYDVLPTLERDLHYGQQCIDIPHTAASFGLKDKRFAGSTLNIELSPEEKEIVCPAIQVASSLDASLSTLDYYNNRPNFWQRLRRPPSRWQSFRQSFRQFTHRQRPPMFSRDYVNTAGSNGSSRPFVRSCSYQPSDLTIRRRQECANGFSRGDLGVGVGIETAEAPRRRDISKSAVNIFRRLSASRANSVNSMTNSIYSAVSSTPAKAVNDSSQPLAYTSPDRLTVCDNDSPSRVSTLETIKEDSQGCLLLDTSKDQLAAALASSPSTSATSPTSPANARRFLVTAVDEEGKNIFLNIK